MEKIILGAGCFWGVEKKFNELEGVISTKVGYSGGFKKDPTYEEVCTGQTGHAEVVKVEYDPEVISFDELLNFFFSIHNPTTLNRQGLDVGTQYRSAIYFYTHEQHDIAKDKIEEIDGTDKFLNAIVTEVKPAENFYLAEEYHQKYLYKNK